jgi:hypothetical protein
VLPGARERRAGWSVAEVVEVAGSLGVPATTDALHHNLNSGALTLEEAPEPIAAYQGKSRSASQSPPIQPGPREAARCARPLRELL